MTYTQFTKRLMEFYFAQGVRCKMEKKGESKNSDAEKVVGLRPIGIPLCSPTEMGYYCPICGMRGDDLQWSEYNSFLWCATCNIDIPSCLCVYTSRPDLGQKKIKKKDLIKSSTAIFLSSVHSAKKVEKE